MRRPASKADKFGATRGKLVLVAVLAIVQVVVIVRAFSGRARPGDGRKVPASATEPDVPAAAAATTVQSTSEARELSRWPDLPLADVLEFNPFARPPWIVEAAEIQVAAESMPSGEIEELKRQGVSIVIVARDGKAATIGSRQFRIGDVIDGYQVTDISTRGVEFTKIPRQ